MRSGSIYLDRFAATMAHQPVDRTPIDLGGTPQAGVDGEHGISNLAKLLGFIGPSPDSYDLFDVRVLEALDIDFRQTGVLIPFETKWNNQTSETEFTDCYGIRYRFSGIYWEIVGGALWGADIDTIAAYDFPNIAQVSAGLFDNIEHRAKQLHGENKYVIAGSHPVLGVLELACWLCGYDQIMTMMALDPEYIHLLFGKILDFQKPIIAEYYRRIGKYIDLTTSGDDFGTQKCLFMSPNMFREFVKPYFQKRIEYTARFTDAIYMHHTCGSVFDIIPDLAEIGVKILNPIQPNATNMEPEKLKAAYGDIMVFHGGLDTQQVLPTNDPEIINQAVDRLIAAMQSKKSGGFIFAGAHCIQPDVSPEAVVRMFRRALEVQA